MSFNGSGTFQINTAGQPVVTGTTITSTAFNALTADLATGLSTCITKDGQTTPTANIPMGSNKITGMAAGTAATDAANLSQAQSTAAKLLTVSGTDTITASGSPTVAAYTTGASYYFSPANTNTGAATINIDSLGAKSITKEGTTALAAGDLTANKIAFVVYDGTRFQLTNPAVNSGQLSNNNTAIGSTAVDSLTSGSYNSGFGATAGTSITSGSYNTGMGYGAIDSVSTGSSNSALGYWAGIGISTGSSNTALGRTALSSGNYSSAVGVGANSSVTGSSQLQLGESTITSYSYGAVQDRSDLRDKADVQPTNLGLDFVMALQPRMFRWDMREDYRPPMPNPETATPEELAAWQQACDLSHITHDGTHKRNRLHQGLIAQEVKATMDAMGVDFGGYQDHKINGGQDVLSIGYNEMIAPLIKAIQELKTEFDAYKATHP
jgi:hypothetical protein